MHIQSVKEALNNDHGVTATHRAMEIEKDDGFSESRRESVLGFRTVNGSSGIRNKEAMFVVDGNHSAPLHEALPTVMADSEVPGSIWCDAAAL
jgi:hypothetical protein